MEPRITAPALGIDDPERSLAPDPDALEYPMAMDAAREREASDVASHGSGRRLAPVMRRLATQAVTPWLLAASLAAVTSTAVPAPAAAQNPARAGADRFESVRAVIREAMAEHGLPSVSVALAKDGRIVWEEAFGWADRERRVPATPHTMYSLASISKPITATGLMRLVEQGGVDLDRPVNDYLGTGKLSGFAGDPSGATVRRVLTHTAGLPLHYQFFYEAGGYGPPSMDETIARYGILVNPPGELYEYSNIGYGILDHVIARVSGMSYADYMRTRVFLPLGMTRTSVDIGPGLEEYAATRYDELDRPIPFYTFDHPGASAVWSSAHDLVKFGMFHLGNRLPDQQRILKDETIEDMQRLHWEMGGGNGRGLGWGISGDDHGFLRVAHTGGMPGVSTALYLYPTEGMVVVVLTNKRNPAMNRIAQEMAAAMLPRYATSLRQRLAASGPAGGEPQEPPFMIEPAAELIGEWAGTLRTHQGTVPLLLDFRPDGTVHIRLDRQGRMLLSPVWYRNGQLIGRFPGTIPTEDAARHPHSVLLNLRLRDGRLSGMATAQTTGDPVYYALSSYVELTRAEGR